MLHSKKILFIILFSFCFSFLIYASLEEARTAYKNNNYSESLTLYSQWLDNNSDSSEYYNILNELSNNKGDIFLLTEILEKHSDNVSDKNKRKLIYVKIAQFYELISNINKAQSYYEKASLILLDKIDYELLLKSSELLLLEGDYFQAETQLKEILLNAPEKNISIHANILYVALKILNSGSLDKISLLSSEDPQSLYIAYLITKLNPELEINTQLENKLIKEYEASPEAAIIKKQIEEIPNILISLGLLNNYSNQDSNILIQNSSDVKEPHPYMIQTGSFRDGENAHYLVLDLKKSGFDATVEEQLINDIIYYKVMLYLSTEEEVRSTMLELKENGFEGFPIY